MFPSRKSPIIPRSFFRRLSALSTLAVVALATASAPLLRADSLMYEERFNNDSNLKLQDGAALGGPGSGVSSLPADRAYSSAGNIPAPGERGPAVLLTGEPHIEAADLREFTVTAWYNPNQDERKDVTLYNGFGTLLIWNSQKHQWTVRVDAKFLDGQNHMYWFDSGSQPPMESWILPGQWMFIAITWSKAENKVTFYQGGAAAATVEAHSVTRNDQVDVLTEAYGVRATVGNDSSRKDRAFDGLVDDVRFFSKKLDVNTLDKIRQADLKNAPISVP